MDDFGMFARDFGIRPQGKSAPMSASRPRPPASSAWTSTPPAAVAPFVANEDPLFDPPSDFAYDAVFGGPSKYSNRSSQAAAPSPSPLDSFFQGPSDAPVYDDDIFDGVPGIKSPGSAKYDDVFSSASPAENSSSRYDDLFGGFGKAEPEPKTKPRSAGGGLSREASGFDDLIPGFGGSGPPSSQTPKRETSETNHIRSTKSTSSMLDDPFVVLESTKATPCSSSGFFTDPLEHLSMPHNSDTTKVHSSAPTGVFDDIQAFDGFTYSVPVFPPEVDKKAKRSFSREGKGVDPLKTTDGNGLTDDILMNHFESAHKKVPADNYRDPQQNPFDIPEGLSNSSKSTSRSGFHPKDVDADEASSQDVSSKSETNLETGDDVWLTVNDIPLFTQLTNAPSPSRPPPPLSIKRESASRAEKGKKADVTNSGKSFGASSIDELEDFAKGRSWKSSGERSDILPGEEEMTKTNTTAAASAAAMKDAMDKAEAKFKQAREMRGRERDAKTFKSRESPQEEDERARKETQESEYREKKEKLDRQQEQRERDEKEREQKRLEREREREREEKARQAVERATREARERAAAQARQKAERAAFQRAAAEARERAAAEARERAERANAEVRERAAAEAREKAAAEARHRAERAAFERAAAEARERASVEARERAAAAAREWQRKNEDDLESFFGVGARANSVPRARSSTSDPAFDGHFQGKGSSDGAQRTSAGSSSTMRKASSATDIVDDLASMFGAAASAREFQEIEGETEERRRSRLERHQRTAERTKKALAEKNERDMRTQREQAERHRIAETLDVEIRRWAAGKEGNLRALLSTLQYVLWPECGWRPVSLTDLITAASVKKVYRKATLCIHPDKVQQKGATIQQKYVAEKVFDLLKEAWNKFNSEELF